MTAPTPQVSTLQPYPLFYAELEAGQIRSGRILGWHSADGLVHAQPVVLFDQSDGTTGDLGYVEPEAVQYCWIRDSLPEAVTAAEEMFNQEVAAAMRRAWPVVVDRIAATDKRAAKVTAGVAVIAFDGKTVTVAATSTSLVHQMESHSFLLKDALYEQMGERWNISVKLREPENIR